MGWDGSWSEGVQRGDGLGDICDALNNKNRLKTNKHGTYRSSRVQQAGLQNLSLQPGFESRVMSCGDLGVARRAFRMFLPHSDWVFVERRASETVAKGGFMLPEKSRGKTLQATVGCSCWTRLHREGWRAFQFPWKLEIKFFFQKMEAPSSSGPQGFFLI